MSDNIIFEDVDPKDVPPQYRSGSPQDIAAAAREASVAGGGKPGAVLQFLDDTASSFGRGMKTFGGAVSEMVTGKKRKTGDYPEFETNTPYKVNHTDEDALRGMALTFGMASASDPLGYANIIKEWVPGSSVTFDVNNNPLIKWQGKTYYANKPGVSGNDMQRLATDMLAFWPAGKWGATGTSLLTKGLKGGAATTMTNLIQQLAGQAMGSDEKLSFGTASVAGMAGVASEVLSPFLNAGAQTLWQRMGKGVMVDTKGNPTPFGRDFVEQVGLDPDNMTVGMWQQLDKYYRGLDAAMKKAMGQGTAEAQQAARGMASKATEADPLSLPKTTGQQTRNQDQLDFEGFARSGRAGRDARGIMTDFDQQQGQAVMDQATQLQRMAGSPPAADAAAAMAARKTGQITSTTPEGFGQVVSEGARDRANSAWGAVGDAYDAVPGGVRLSADPLLKVPNAITTDLQNMLGVNPAVAGFDKVYPNTYFALNHMRELMATKAALPPSKRSFGLMELETQRRLIMKLQASAPSPADEAALGVVKSRLDKSVNEVWDDALLKGDETALAQLKEARKTRTEYARMFEPDDVEQTVTNRLNKMLQANADNNEVMNWVMGTTEVGFPKAGLQMIQQLGKIFGKSSPEYGALREAAINKIIYGSKSGAMRDMQWDTGKAIADETGAVLRRLDNHLDLQGSAVMKEMFTDAELSQLRRFRYELRQIQPGNNKNLLKTGASVPLWMMKVGSWIDNTLRVSTGGLSSGAVNSVMESGVKAADRAGATAAVQGWQPQFRSVPLFSAWLTGASTGAAGADGPPEQQQPQY